MKIKTKLRLGFGFLFVVVIIFGLISLFFMNRISGSTKVILKDNYESLRLTRKMRQVLDKYATPWSQTTALQFEEHLNRESRNVTEIGEQEAVDAINRDYQFLYNPGADPDYQLVMVANIRKQLDRIDDLNMKAIERKHAQAQQGVEQSATYLIFGASLCFIILFSFSVNFPGFVAKPLREFSAAIKGIARKNYKQRLEFKGQDEFSELAEEFNIMAAQLNKWENSNLATLQSEKLRIEAIIEQMQDAIIGLNEKKEILFLNDIAGKLLNLKENDVVGLNALELSTRNDLLNNILQSKKSEKPLKIYTDGKESYFQLERREIIVPVYDDQYDQTLNVLRKTAGEVFILKNITQYKELDEAKTNFIATVSHELKTPISSIKMSLKLMDDERVGQMNPEQKQLVQHIKDDCGRLLKITSELLNLAQAETGNLQLNLMKSDPKKIAVYAMDAVRVQAEQKSIALELVSKNNLPSINVDTEKTAWVLVNFLSNALRYSAEKSKVIVQIIQKGNNVEFSVKDFGKGIDEQYQKRLFDKYFQVPTDGNNKSGSGLGLAISKDFITAEGGQIWVESEIGAGSRFCFAIPVAE